MKRLAEIFSDERKKMEGQWDRGDDVSTEDLRVGLQRYRSFFNRLLATRVSGAAGGKGTISAATRS